MGAKSKKDYDFAGWVTMNNVKCSDGRTIRQNAFAHMDGKRVSLVYNHDHQNLDNVLGYVDLENRKQGVYGYAKCADTDNGNLAKELVHSGALVSFSIYANNLSETAEKDVMHGDIKEVSLVQAGANPEAFIDEFFEHGVDGDTGMFFYNADHGDSVFDFLSHSDEDDEEKRKKALEEEEDKDEEEQPESDEEEDDEEPEEEDEEIEDKRKKKLQHSDDASAGQTKTVEDIIETMNDEQKDAMYALIGAALEDKNGGSDEDEEDIKHSAFEGGESMKTNLFENDQVHDENVLEHSDLAAILETAKDGSKTLKQTFNEYCLAHSIDTTGMNILPASSTASQTYGVRDLDMLFPEYKAQNTIPEFIKRDTTWVDIVMAGVKKVPYKRIKSLYANITEDEARAKGYIKGDQKDPEVFELLGRTTDPQTIYKLQQLDRDDIIDIEDFDVVAWIKGEMQLMLNEEKARAILIGDGRTATNKYKIKEDHVRSIVNDVPLYNIKVNVNVAANADEATQSKELIKAVLRARKQYKGSGNPTFYTTEDVLTELLLLEDTIGHPLYKTVEELATKLRVRNIVTVEPMEGQQVDSKPLMGVIVNLNDYMVGGDGNREKGIFEDFDIDFNQYKYLIETRMSGALVKPFSAMTILLNKASSAQG